ncbi:hypothetical protein [Promicromonospora sp. MEB111]|uniref:hypothetical protein n=1 Tax=Promicromonospora sp. MEB111 TaxID=3040301 RepID=UPI00254BB6D7|nr:hypothetical protein [Promicromonospora sp. MEB111]
MSALERGDVVRVVAETLANGAPHPHHGKAGVVLEVRGAGLYPVRVQVAGRAVMFAVDELQRDVAADVAAGATESSG